ncbi:MAG: DUF4258 domain-containing protein [Nevskiales bacterium]
MKYSLTAHAQAVIQERGIKPAWLEQVLNTPTRVEPDKADPDLKHHLGAIAEYDDRVLRVVADIRVRPARVVTVYFDRAMKGKL